MISFGLNIYVYHFKLLICMCIFNVPKIFRLYSYTLHRSNFWMRSRFSVFKIEIEATKRNERKRANYNNKMRAAKQNKNIEQRYLFPNRSPSPLKRFFSLEKCPDKKKRRYTNTICDYLTICISNLSIGPYELTRIGVCVPVHV